MPSPACPASPGLSARGSTASCHWASGRALGMACASNVSTSFRARVLSNRCQPACETANPRGFARGAALSVAARVLAEFKDALGGYWAEGWPRRPFCICHCTQHEKIRLNTSHSTPPTASFADADSLSAGREGLTERLSEDFVSRKGNTLFIPARPPCGEGG